MRKISVIIVNYNVKGFLEQCLRSVEKASAGLTVETIVVDNASVDGSVEMVRQLFPNVHLIANQENVGFGKANNQAFKIANGDFLFALNPDTIIREDTLHVLLQFMEHHPTCGACGCKILDPDGSFSPTSRRSFPTPQVSLYRILGLSKFFPKHPVFGKYNLTFVPENQQTEIDALSGSCMFIRKSVIEATKGFDEQFFMYGEDLDLCFRIQQLGWKIIYTPETEIIHFKGESTKKGELKYVKIFYGAMIIFMEKHFTSRYSKIFTTLLKTSVWIRAGFAALATFIRNQQSFLIEFLLFLLALICPEMVSKALSEPSNWDYSTQIAPFFAFITLLLIRLLGGFPIDKTVRLRPVLYGWFMGFLSVAALSFFLKEIAFSRLFIISGFLLGGFFLSLKRIKQYLKQKASRQGLLVGNFTEFHRLQQLLAQQENPFKMVGFLGDEPNAMGTFSQIRDVIRLHHIDDLIFAEADISNANMFLLMRQVNDLALAFRIFPKGRNHLLGQASLNEFTNPPFIAIEHPLNPNYPYIYERFLAFLGILLFPIAILTLGTKKWTQLFKILSGKMSLVGCTAAQKSQLPAQWKVVEGLFPVFSDTNHPKKHQIMEQYATYFRQKNWLLDIEIILRHLG